MKRKKTAFVLAGGGAKGAYECGALLGLEKLGIKADIVCGSSSGSLVGALYVAGNLDIAVEMFSKLETDMLFDIRRNAKLFDFALAFLLNKGAEPEGLEEGIHLHVNEDKVRNSKIDYGLVTLEIPKLKGHYLWKEDIPLGKIKDFILASCSAFPFVRYSVINGKKYIDGAFADVMPTKMALKRGAKFIVEIDLLRNGIDHRKNHRYNAKIITISSLWDMGFPMSFDADRQQMMLTMGYLDALKAFDKYSGYYYTFSKRAFGKKELKGADCAARFFNLDPAKIYNRRNLIQSLKKTIKTYIKSEKYHQLTNVEKLASILSTESLESLDEKDGMGFLVLSMASKIREEGRNSSLLKNRYAPIFGDSIAAAKFLVDNNLYTKFI